MDDKNKEATVWICYIVLALFFCCFMYVSCSPKVSPCLHECLTEVLGCVQDEEKPNRYICDYDNKDDMALLVKWCEDFCLIKDKIEDVK